jgi:BlaI family penicillinase repressor
MNPKISPAEWEIMNVVWDSSPATAAQVRQALAGHGGWHQKTVNTFLGRLVDKGVLRVQREGKANVYSPRLTREQCVVRESESFLQRVFRGATAPLLAHFCERAELSDEDIATLQRMLRQRSSKGRKK